MTEEVSLTFDTLNNFILFRELVIDFDDLTMPWLGLVLPSLAFIKELRLRPISQEMLLEHWMRPDVVKVNPFFWISLEHFLEQVLHVVSTVLNDFLS